MNHIPNDVQKKTNLDFSVKKTKERTVYARESIYLTKAYGLKSFLCRCWDEAGKINTSYWFINI